MTRIADLRFSPAPECPTCDGLGHVPGDNGGWVVCPGCGTPIPPPPPLHPALVQAAERDVRALRSLGTEIATRGPNANLPLASAYQRAARLIEQALTERTTP